MRILAALPALACLLALAGPAPAAEPPRFQVDPSWPKPLPNDWILGQAAGVAVDAQDHVWVIQRPRTLTDDEKAAASIRREASAASRLHPCWNSIRTAPCCGAGAARAGL